MSAPDRTAPPQAGPTPAITLPRIDRARTENGLRVAATVSTSTPEWLFEFALPCGRVHEPLGREGLASLTAAMLQEGTRSLSTVEFVDALDFLGAEFEVGAGDDELVAHLRVLDKHAERALELVADVLLEPRLGEAEFERLRQLRKASLRSRADDAAAVARDAWARLFWGRSTSLGCATIGSESSWKATALDDVRAFHSRAAGARVWRCCAVGAGGLERAMELLAPLDARMASRPAANNASWNEPTPLARSFSRVYLVDRPGAPQSELRVGHASVPSSHPDWLALTALNLTLGGVFSSRLNLTLRETRGYTYGVRSSFEGGRRPGAFLVATSVHTQNTADALREITSKLEGYAEGPTDAELAFTRSSLEQSLARQFETPQARLNFVETVERLGLGDDYPLRRIQWLAQSSREERARVLSEHLRPGELTLLAVGDRAQVERGLHELGHGAPTRLDSSGDEFGR